MAYKFATRRKAYVLKASNGHLLGLGTEVNGPLSAFAFTTAKAAAEYRSEFGTRDLTIMPVMIGASLVPVIG